MTQQLTAIKLLYTTCLQPSLWARRLAASWATPH